MGQNASPRGQNGLKKTCLRIPKGPGSPSEKRVFDPLFTHFCSQNGPFSRHFGIFHGPKRVPTGLKWAKNTCWRIPKGPGSLLEKRVFDPFSTHFCSQNGPFSRHFGVFHGPKRVPTGSKWAKNTCWRIPKGPGSLLEKRVFDPFFTHFCSQNGPFSRHFGIFHGPKRVPTGSKWAKNTCWRIPKGPGSLLEKRVFDPFFTHFCSQNGVPNRVKAEYLCPQKAASIFQHTHATPDCAWPRPPTTKDMKTFVTTAIMQGGFLPSFLARFHCVGTARSAPAEQQLGHNLGILYQNFQCYLRVGAKFYLHQVLPFQILHVPPPPRVFCCLLQSSMVPLYVACPGSCIVPQPPTLSSQRSSEG